MWNQYILSRDLLRRSFPTEEEILSLAAYVNNYSIETRNHQKWALCINKCSSWTMLEDLLLTESN